jgi:hypothetical protein
LEMVTSPELLPELPKAKTKISTAQLANNWAVWERLGFGGHQPFLPIIWPFWPMLSRNGRLTRH